MLKYILNMHEYNGFALTPVAIEYEEASDPISDFIQLAGEAQTQILDYTDRFGVGTVSLLVGLYNNLDNLSKALEKNRTQIEAMLPILSAYLIINPDILGLGKAAYAVYRTFRVEPNGTTDYSSNGD